MVDLHKITGFEWDRWNIDKSYQKHGITPNEAEEVFLDESFCAEPDIAHQQIEPRFIGIGKTFEGKVLFVVFTIRGHRIRIVSARKANQAERRIYEKGS